MTSPATLRCAVPAGEGTSTQEACVGSIHDPFVWNILSCTARMEIFKLMWRTALTMGSQLESPDARSIFAHVSAGLFT
ncbi:hypothetical protein V5799_005873 [Amblyomma americanum]|uniref:Uncharacterized protein n=1 Tax=Amblyomma americanum TaxID=6943 RepID=A0AAQ4DY06_AMBAM